jgi:hypothetical protein
MELSGIPPERVEQARALSISTHTEPVSLIGSFVGGIVGRIIICSFLAAVFTGLIFLLGHRINYWQALSVAAFSFLPVTIIQKSFSLVLLFFLDPATIHPVQGTSGLLPDNLSFLVSSTENTFLYGLAGYLSVLGFYWLWLMARGLKDAASRASAGAGWTAAVIVWLLGLLPILLSGILS